MDHSCLPRTWLTVLQINLRHSGQYLIFGERTVCYFEIISIRTYCKSFLGALTFIEKPIENYKFKQIVYDVEL